MTIERRWLHPELLRHLFNVMVGSVSMALARLTSAGPIAGLRPPCVTGAEIVERGPQLRSVTLSARRFLGKHLLAPAERIEL